MSLVFKLFVVSVALLFSLFIIVSLVKRKIHENVSILWFIGSTVIVIIAIFPQILNKMAAMLGVDYPPALLFLVSTILLFIISFFQSMHISKIDNRLKELTQQFAIEKMKNEED
jgi:hypothetical protein